MLLNKIFFLTILLAIGVDIAHSVSVSWCTEESYEQEKDMGLEGDSEETVEKDEHKRRTTLVALVVEHANSIEHKDNFAFQDYNSNIKEGVPSPPPDHT